MTPGKYAYIINYYDLLAGREEMIYRFIDGPIRLCYSSNSWGDLFSGCERFAEIDEHDRDKARRMWLI